MRRGIMRRYVGDYYVVQPGDTLSGIAAAFFGRANAYRYLAAVNGLPNPNFIVPGQVIMLD
jgi:nucleoid-associated protein YgaU